MKSIVATKNLVKRFGNVEALRGLELEARKGISGIIGPNGAGKTTTLNILLGLVKPDEGEASVFGLDCWHQSFEVRRRVGVLHEKPHYPDCFTGLRFLEHVAHIKGVKEAKRRAKEVLNEVGLAKAAERQIKTYSAGMAQRLGLAQALIGDPELVLLDEPTSNLDPLGRMEFLQKIKSLYKDHEISFLISSHILPELERICDWVSIIDRGVILDQGAVKDLTAKYSANVYKIVVSDPMLLVKHLNQTGSVEKAWIEGEIVYSQVRDVNTFYGDVPRIVSELGIQLKMFTPVYERLEEIFRAALRAD